MASIRISRFLRLIKLSFIFFFIMFIRQFIDVENLSKIGQQNDFLNDPRLLKYRKNAVEFEDDNEMRWENFTLRFSGSHYKYRMSITKKQICKKVKLLIMVPSRPTAFGERREIRWSWARNLSNNTRVYFIIGKHANYSVNNKVINEALYYNDMILNDLYDSYTNLTLKIYAMLQWKQSYCAKTLYTLKTDDDTIVHISRLLYWMKNKFDTIVKLKPKTIFGRIFAGTKVNHNPKKPWYIDPVVYSKRRFPAYCNGPTYMVTKQAVRTLLREVPYVPFMSVEDITFTGILAKRSNVYLYDISLNVDCDDNMTPYITSLYNVSKVQMKMYYNKLFSARCIGEE